MPGPLSRLRLRLSLRMLLLLILVADVGLSWPINKARRQREAVAQIMKDGGFVFFDDQDGNGNDLPDSHYSWTNWLRRRLGEEFFREEKVVSMVLDRPLSDATLAPLADIWRIERLEINIQVKGGNSEDPTQERSRLTEKGLARIEALARLRRLNLHNVRWTGSGLRHLSLSPQLGELYLSEDHQTPGTMTDERMPPFETMQRLRRLHLSCSGVTTSCLRSLRGSTNLEELVFYDGTNSADGFKHIGTMTNLEMLRIRRGPLGDIDLSELRNLTRLKYLDLCADGSEISDAGLVHLAGMTQLEALRLLESKITGRGLVALRGLERLKDLDLRFTPFDDDGLKVLAEILQLESMRLDDTEVTEAGLLHLKSLKLLKRLTLIGTSVTKQADAEFRKAIPGLREISY